MRPETPLQQDASQTTNNDIELFTSERTNNAIGFHTCNTLRCGACKIHASQTKFAYSTSLNTQFKIQQSLTCASHNIVYLITCARCNLQYVGETSRTLRERLTDHRSNIKTKKPTPISVHFSTPMHSFQDLRIIAIEKIPEQTNSLLNRRDRENYWIKKLATKHPQGLNYLPFL
jgi:tripartite motif-containing protein 2/3